MKKSLEYLVFLAVCFLFLTFNVNAAVVTEEQLENSYVIGTHLFTENGPRLTTREIMLAAKTIESDDLSDMIIYFKPAGLDTWINALDNTEVAEPTGIREDNYFTYIDLEPQEEALESLELTGAVNVDTTEVVDDTYGDLIKYNQESISVTQSGNVITVTEDRFMKSWDNTVAEGKWYAILVDLGIDKDNVEAIGGYTIEEVDKTDADRFGAENNNQFVLWLRGDVTDTSRTITFRDKTTSETTDVTIEFKATDVAEATTIEELNTYLANDNIKTINLMNGLDLSSAVYVNRAVTINGNNTALTFDAYAKDQDNTLNDTHGIIIGSDNVTIQNLTVTMNNGTDDWGGVYGIQVYDSVDVTLSNITVNGADGGIIVNASDVTLDGTIDVSDNEFGGMEVSIGTQAQNQTSTLNVGDATLVNDTEAYGLPTIWTDGDENDGRLVVVTDMAYTMSVPGKENQKQYYLDSSNFETVEVSEDVSLDDVLANEDVDTIYLPNDYTSTQGTLTIDRPVTIIGNGATITNEVTISGDNVTIQDVAFTDNLTVTGANTVLDEIEITGVTSEGTGNGDGYNVVKVDTTGDFTMKNSTIDNASSTGSFYNALNIKADGVVTIEGNAFTNTDNVYNVIEFSQSVSTASGTTIKGNTFDGDNKNNIISMFKFEDNTVINIEDNEFAFSGNALRVSNYTNANNVTINISNNKYEGTLTGAYAGFMLFQAPVQEGFSGFVVNVTNLIGPSGNLVTADSSGQDVFCYYYRDDTVGNILPEEDEATINFLD